MSTQAQQQQQQGLDITTLPTAQLSQLQSRLSSELEHLSTSHARLRAAQTRFKDCIRSIADGVENKSAGTLRAHLYARLSTSIHCASTSTLRLANPGISKLTDPRNPPPNSPNNLPLRPRPPQPLQTQHSPRRRRNRLLRRENHKGRHKVLRGQSR